MSLRRKLFVFSPWAIMAAVALAFAASHYGSAEATGSNTITTPDAGRDTGQFSSIALDGSGNPVISYYDVYFGDLKLLRCDDPACDGDEATHIATPDGYSGDQGYTTSLALDGQGNPVIAYWDAILQNLRILHCDDPYCAGNESAHIAAPDGPGDVGQYASMALDGSGNPVVSYYDFTGGHLKVLHCDDPGCLGDESAHIATISTLGAAGSYTSLVLDGSGNPVISYREIDQQGLGVLHCGNPNCTGGNTVEMPDHTGDVGWWSSIVLVRSVNPVISYGGSLFYNDPRLIHCNDPACAGGNDPITGFDLSEDSDSFTSIALDGAGNPIFVYYDRSVGYLKVMHCNNANCGTGGYEMPEPAHNAGSMPSMVLDGSGRPVISYYDVDNGDLKVLHCGNPTCAAGGGPKPTAPPPPSATPTQPASPTATATEPGPQPTATEPAQPTATEAAQPTSTQPPGEPTDTPTPTRTRTAKMPRTSTPARTATQAPAGQRGDANCDGSVNALDAAVILQYGAGTLRTLRCPASAATPTATAR